MNRKVLFITQAAVIAALYVVLTYVAALLGLSSGAIQVRFSEALTVLPYFIPSAIDVRYADNRHYRHSGYAHRLLPVYRSRSLSHLL